jgi:hypothetical protein
VWLPFEGSFQERDREGRLMSSEVVGGQGAEDGHPRVLRPLAQLADEFTTGSSCPVDGLLELVSDG